MKTAVLAMGLVSLMMMAMNAMAQDEQGLSYHIVNQNAQAVYQGLTGVREESALGNTYREGKSILCWHIDKDVQDEKGVLIPSQDPRRYACSMSFDRSGLASPGEQF